MTSFAVTEPVAVPAAVAWQTVGDFADDSWMGLPMTVDGVGMGAVRTIEAPGASIVERCERLDPVAMVLGYETVSGSRLPATNYHGTLTVRPTGESSCEIEWAADYDTDDVAAMEAALGSAFGGGLRAMGQQIEAR
jgi:hypothetical protein